MRNEKQFPFKACKALWMVYLGVDLNDRRRFARAVFV